jgi:hypothetical protein
VHAARNEWKRYAITPDGVAGVDRWLGTPWTDG